MKNTSKRHIEGFTLIELLVVVLIIGVLASVALPQYTLAVEKSRTAEAWAILFTVKEAMEAYSMANGGDMSALVSAEDPWSMLDISLPLKDSGHNKKGLKESKNFTYAIESPNYVRAYRGRATGSSWTDLDYQLFIDLNGKQWSYSQQGYRLCDGTTAKGKKLCKNLGPRLGDNKYMVR